MQRNRRSLFLAVTLAALSLLATRPAAADLLPVVLPFPAGYSYAVAFAINDSGDVAGFVLGEDTLGNSIEAGCLWQDRVPTVLPLPVGATKAEARGLNNSRQVIGFYVVPDGVTFYDLERPVLWSPDNDYVPQDLGVLEGDTQGRAHAINNAGQVLCSSWGGTSGTRYFLWEPGPVRTLIAMPDSTPIDPIGLSWLVEEVMLFEDGTVAGTAPESVLVEATPVLLNRAVIWTKAGGGVKITLPSTVYTSTAQAASDNGIVVCSTTVVGLEGQEAGPPFMYDLNTQTLTELGFPDVGPDLIRVGYQLLDVNDSGQAVVELMLTDELYNQYIQLWVYQAGEWTQIPIDTLLETGETAQFSLAFNNNAGQLAGVVLGSKGVYPNEEEVYRPFFWSASTGLVRLASSSGAEQVLPTDINDSGLIVGAQAQVSGETYVVSSLVWGASLEFSPGPVTVTKKKTLVFVLVSNPFEVKVTDAIVTSFTVTKDEVSEDILLKKPIKIGSIDPGGTAILQLEFGPTFTAPFSIELTGSSSAGAFDETVSWELVGALQFPGGGK